MLTLVRHLAGQAADLFEQKLLDVAKRLSWKRRRTLARRERQRPQERGRWFTPAERVVVAALAALIIPSDGNGPGANEADVAGALDSLLARSPSRHDLYRYGLLACDEWAFREHGRTFATLDSEQQQALLRWVDLAAVPGARASSLTRKLRRKALQIYRKWRCPLVELFPELSRDVMGAFYTHRVCWAWLGYDGPPMPDGYPDLRERPAATIPAPTMRHAL